MAALTDQPLVNPEIVTALRKRARFMTVNTIDFTDLLTVEVGGFEGDVVITTETAEYLYNQLACVLGKEPS
jgi:hypothetical protein